jgi:hypothetical protein
MCAAHLTSQHLTEHQHSAIVFAVFTMDEEEEPAWDLSYMSDEERKFYVPTLRDLLKTLESVPTDQVRWISLNRSQDELCYMVRFFDVSLNLC